MRRRARILLLGSAFALAFATPAIADDTICVNLPPGCDFDFTSAQLQTALNTADGDGDNDTVMIGPGTYSQLNGFSYQNGNPVSIIGAGQGQTTITADADAGFSDVLNVTGAAATVSDMTITINPVMSDLDDGLVLSSANATRVTVDGTGTDNTDGVILIGGSFTEGTVTMPKTSVNGTRNFFVTGQPPISDTEMVGEVGIAYSQENNAMTLQRSEIEASGTAIETTAGTVNVDNTLIDLGNSANATALRAENSNMNDDSMTINARHVTIVGGGANSKALRAVADSNLVGEDATVNFDDSVISGPAIPIQALADNGDTATVATDFSNYNPAGTEIDNDLSNGGATGFTNVVPTNQTNFAPGFLNAAAGNYRPVFGSALIDAGDPTAPGPALDLDDSARVVDGDGTGPPRRDIGAYELDDLVGPSASVTTGPSGPTGDSTPTFDFAASEPGSSFVCRIDGTAFAPCSGPGDSHTPGAALDDGSHEFEVRPTDPTGNVGTVGTRSFSIDASAPVIQLSGPTGLIADSTPTFNFSSGEAASFECRFDADPFGPCSGPGNTHTPSPLADGLRTFEVRGTDALGNSAQSSGSVSIDATGPETTATKPTVKKRTATVAFAATETATFQCKLDKGAFAPAHPRRNTSGSPRASTPSP